MYHEEKVIDGVLSWRGTPDGKFTPYTPKALTARIVELERIRDVDKAITSYYIDRANSGLSVLEARP